jgi:quinol monooxygenase YgiN
MKRIMVRYTVKDDHAAENERYIRDVFEQLRRETPPNIRYASFKLADGVSFVHIASHETTDGSNPLRDVSAFQAFTATVKDRCESPPVAAELTEIGSYRFFGD